MTRTVPRNSHSQKKRREREREGDRDTKKDRVERDLTDRGRNVSPWRQNILNLTVLLNNQQIAHKGKMFVTFFKNSQFI